MGRMINNNREQEHIILNMKDAGCSEDTIQRFHCLDERNDWKEYLL